MQTRSRTFIVLIVALASAVACRSTLALQAAPRAIPVGTASIYVDDAPGKGTPIVFIHGNGGSSAQWKAQLEHFRGGGRRAVAIDLPGFGRSTAPSDYSLASMTAAIDAALSHLGLEPFVIVGHSYGGAVVASYAAAHPDRVAAVVYLDAAASRLPLTAEQQSQFAAGLRANKMAVVRQWFAPMLAPSPDAVKQEVFASVEKTPADAVIGALMSLTDYDARKLVDGYRGPRFAIVAADLENEFSFQRQFPSIPATKISGAGHWLMLDKPAEVNAALDRVLAR